MAPIFGPGRRQLIDVLRGTDWRQQLPVQLANGGPCAVVRLDETGGIQLRALAVDREAADAERARRTAGGDTTWMPENEFAFLVEAQVVVEAATPAAFIEAIEALDPWPFGAEDSEAVAREVERDRQETEANDHRRRQDRQERARREHATRLRKQRSARLREELYALATGDDGDTRITELADRLDQLEPGERKALLGALPRELGRAFATGVELFRGQKYDDAYPYLDLTCRHWSGVPSDDAWTLHAMTYLWNERKEFDASAAWVRQFVASGTEIPPAAVPNCVNAFTGAACYDEAIAVGLAGAARGAPPSVHHSLACAFALAGRADEALDQIEHARERGYEDSAALAADPQLASVRDHPRFRRALAQ
jgi:hypothetical protein